MFIEDIPLRGLLLCHNNGASYAGNQNFTIAVGLVGSRAGNLAVFSVHGRAICIPHGELRASDGRLGHAVELADQQAAGPMVPES